METLITVLNPADNFDLGCVILGLAISVAILSGCLRGGALAVRFIAFGPAAGAFKVLPAFSLFWAFFCLIACGVVTAILASLGLVVGSVIIIT